MRYAKRPKLQPCTVRFLFSPSQWQGPANSEDRHKLHSKSYTYPIPEQNRVRLSCDVITLQYFNKRAQKVPSHQSSGDSLRHPSNHTRSPPSSIPGHMGKTLYYEIFFLNQELFMFAELRVSRQILLESSLFSTILYERSKLNTTHDSTSQQLIRCSRDGFKTCPRCSSNKTL
jgi:hypothetical protein